MKMTTAVATYINCYPDCSTQQMEIDTPADRTTPEGVASYLRFGGRMSQSVLESFTWAGQTYDAMGRSIS